ncbi:hypothetical protein [uncultured Oscillibacter sp.]|uniref:hypothetical protein n=1 Tax=uncultured Oscillibacter sp. TaxID=876091 RepID=UPI0026291359|nr:hypothetical protein [uncultured Oscillibacter sp.]
MTPLMQTICDHLTDCCLEHYIDGCERDTNAMEREQVRSALAAFLPDCCQELLSRYDALHLCRLNLENEAMFQAAFAAARELS